MNMYVNIIDLIGNTPLVKLNRITKGNVFVKAEFLNPGGSIKDRVGKYIIEDAEKRGLLKPESVIIEASSGNTGIGFALVGAQKGYRVIIVMPGSASEEREKIIRAFGGEVILTPKEEFLDGALKKVEVLKRKIPNVFVPGQFENPKNPETHYFTTAPEIWEQMGGKIDIFVAGVGSGGTLTGVGKFLKEKNQKIMAVAVEPKSSAALLGREPGLHQIQGIGDGFVPKVLDKSIIDTVITVSDEDAINTTRELAKKEGLLVGTSSGANVWAACHLASHKKNVVTVLPDRAERYFSTALI